MVVWDVSIIEILKHFIMVIWGANIVEKGNRFPPLEFFPFFSIVASKPSNIRDKRRDKIIKKKGNWIWWLRCNSQEKWREFQWRLFIHVEKLTPLINVGFIHRLSRENYEVLFNGSFSQTLPKSYKMIGMTLPPS